MKESENNIKYLCEENDNVIFVSIVDEVIDELLIGTIGCDSYTIIGIDDLSNCLEKLGLTIINSDIFEKYKFFKDQGLWVCVENDFIDLASSVAGFGETKKEAYEDYFENYFK